ncbi:kinase [Rhizobium rhizosphaerae]|uniref:Kinase n=1 Tax=Xaviernesmea rhizosphaerae TaxID=1672749 RepID=A0ABX3PDG0_9HYPH|nr:AAA family ATPase [Xaviernesmea rhizosphaerae]OQP86514.1 kinase [Xaviernesmea rhizosphaerae]
MLIIFGGLPASGKSTIAGALARALGACYLRVDTIEQAILAHAPLAERDVGPAGYVALYRLAADNLRLGNMVITDSVNPLDVTRDAFRSVAIAAGRPFIEVEVACSNAATHRHRAETRQALAGESVPSWAEIEARRFEAWSADLRLDTFRLSVEDCVAQIAALTRSRADQA